MVPVNPARWTGVFKENNKDVRYFAYNGIGLPSFTLVLVLRGAVVFKRRGGAAGWENTQGLGKRDGFPLAPRVNCAAKGS